MRLSGQSVKKYKILEISSEFHLKYSLSFKVYILIVNYFMR
jgi:hypothetical protein